jgi:membrane-bound metal-dependent hydrolase YbcI (DUF457 family)
MLVFGHAGITLGAAWLLSTIISKSHQPKMEDSSQIATEATYNQSPALEVQTKMKKNSWITNLSAYIDIRILLIASLLPDIIDKPLGQLIFRQTFSNGRLFGHTLLFFMVVAILGLIYYGFYRKTWPLVIAFGIFMHLILDQMWNSPSTLLWPLYGTSFPRIDLSNWLTNMINLLLTHPIVALPEISGMLVIFLFCIEILRKRSVIHFIRYGTLN